MKKLVPLLLFISIAFIGCSVEKQQPPGDLAVSNYLTNNKSDLEYIVSKIENYPAVSRIAIYDGEFSTRPHGVLPLLDDTFIATIDRIKLQILEIQWCNNEWQIAEFVLFSSGLVLGGESKSLVYSKSVITENIYEDLDKAREDAIAQYTSQTTSRTFKGYKALGDGWYIYQYIYF